MRKAQVVTALRAQGVVVDERTSADLLKAQLLERLPRTTRQANPFNKQPKEVLINWILGEQGYNLRKDIHESHRLDRTSLERLTVPYLRDYCTKLQMGEAVQTFDEDRLTAIGGRPTVKKAAAPLVVKMNPISGGA